MKFILDCSKMVSMSEIHEQLKNTLPLPGYYGKNLDALWDILSELSEPMEIILENFSDTPEKTKTYVNSLVKVLDHVAKKRDNFKFTIS